MSDSFPGGAEERGTYTFTAEVTMTTRLLWRLALLAVLFCLITGMGLGRQAQGDAKDKEALAKRGEAFVELFHKGDAEGLAAFWTPDGELIDESGPTLKGRKAIDTS